jgi:hypothetical protein
VPRAAWIPRTEDQQAWDDDAKAHMKAQATTHYPFVPSGRHFARSIAFFAALERGKNLR